MKLQVSHLSVGYDRTLIQDLNLEMDLGDRLIVYGSNGTGKSTLLHTLISAAKSKSAVHWQLPPEQILFLHQQSSFHNQTPDDVDSYLLNILLYKKPFSSATQKDFQNLQDVKEKLQLNNMPLKNLSGGQRQKLKIARALLMETKALLLDEPFNAIDQKSTHEIIDWLNASRKEMLQILVLHDFDQIEKLKSQILWIQETGWEILEFQDWFQKVDKRFHSWMHTVHNHNQQQGLK